MDRRLFIRTHARILALGFLLAFVSSLGQTFFIGLFKESLLETLPGLTHGSYGEWYMGATLASALCLAYLGRRIDDIDLGLYSIVICVGLAGACALISFADSIAVLVISLFLLRLFGQGLMSHTANTATARYVERGRGRALALVNLGHPAGEALLPVLAVGLMHAAGWRSVWRVGAIVVVVLVIPAVVAVLRGHRERHARWAERVGASGDGGGGAAATSESPGGSVRQWTAREVILDLRFLRCVPAFVTLPFIATGLFFHQDVLRADLGWGESVFSYSFGAYSLTQVLSAPVIGAWVDRVGAGRALPLLPLPAAVVLGVLPFLDGEWRVFAMMAGMGLSSGFAFSVVGAVLAERYGTRFLGAIRSQLSVMMVVSTALSPPAVGWAIDRGISMATVMLIFAGGAAVASLLAIGGGRR